MSSILPPENIYDHAVTFKPQIKEQQYLLESQKKMLRVAQAGYYPKLNFGASYSNGYYHSTSGGEFADTRSFSEQFKQNGQKIVGFSLSIPLFNRFQVRNSVRTARINIINRELLPKRNIRLPTNPSRRARKRSIMPKSVTTQVKALSLNLMRLKQNTRKV